MASPATSHVPGRGVVKSLFVPEIVRNRDEIRLRSLGDVPGASAIKAVRCEDLNSHLEETLPRGLPAVTARPGSGGY